ncbi:MAG: hypothetical protein ABI193_02440, partial [Minicystis sp.]
MKALPLRAPLFIFLASLVAGCGLIAGIKDRTLDEGSGGSSTSATTSSTTAITTSAGGAGGQSATASTGTSMGGGGSAPCPQQVLGVE